MDMDTEGYNRMENEDEEQPYERMQAVAPPRKRMPLPIRLATGEVIYRATDGTFDRRAMEAEAEAETDTNANANANANIGTQRGDGIAHDAEENRTQRKPKGHVYASKEIYFTSEDAIRSHMAFLCTKVMAAPDSRQIVADLVNFLADYEALSSKFSERLTEEIDISLDILLKDVGGHGPLAGLSWERQRKLKERQKQLVKLCLQGNGNAKDKIISAIELDKMGYTTNNLVIAFGQYLDKARYSIKSMFIFDVFLSLYISDGVSDLDPNAGRSIKYFLNKLDSEERTVKYNKKMTKRQKSLAIELKEYKNELKREGIRQSQNDMIAIHSSTLTELFAIFTIILRKQFNHCVYSLEKVFLGCERYHRFLSIMYVKDLSAVIRNMILSSIVSMPEAVLDRRMALLDYLTSQPNKSLVCGKLSDTSDSPPVPSLRLLLNSKKQQQGQGQGQTHSQSAQGQQRGKGLDTRQQTKIRAMVSQKVSQPFGLTREFSRIEGLFTQKLLEKDAYATRRFILPVRAGITGCLVVGKIQSELKGIKDIIELDLIIPFFYLLMHSLDVTTADTTKLYVRAMFYCLQPSIQTKERIAVVKSYLQLMKHMAVERESWTVIDTYYNSLVKRYGDDENSDFD